MDYAKVIHMLYEFQHETFNLGFKVAKNDPSADDKQMTDKFREIVNYIKQNTKETKNV